MHGRSVTVERQSSLGTKTQLTVSGNILFPAISPDGKQLAYVDRRCNGADCTYAVVEQDVGGTTTRSILDNATAFYGIWWSPDRRNLIFNGTVGGRYGSYLLSALGSAPRFLTPGAAAFHAGGDSLLIGPGNAQDSVYWVKVTGLDAIPRDSIAVRGKGQFLNSLSAIPGSPWILTLIIQAPHGLWQVIGRDGKVADHVVNQCTCGGIGSVDAIWLDRAGDAAGESIVRIPVDPATGYLSAQQDTMVTGIFTNVSVTADGGRMVMDQGTVDYGMWTTSLAYGSSTARGTTHFGVLDVRTGAERNAYDLPDSVVRAVAPLPDGWVWVPAGGTRIVIEEKGKQRELPVPAWYSNVGDVQTDPAHGRAYLSGFNRTTTDSLGVFAVNLADGTMTRWAAAFAEDGGIQVLDGGDVLFQVHHTADAFDLYRLRGPDAMARIGSPRAPLLDMSVSRDLKRVTAVQRSYSADAWMYNVVKR